MKNLIFTKETGINRFRITDNHQWTEREIEWWNLKKDKLKNRFPYLSADDLNIDNGLEKRMIMLLCYKLHINKQMLENIILAL